VVETAVILAAGRGSRLASAGSEEFSKPLMQLRGQTLLERTIGCCRVAGMQRIIVVTGFRADLVNAELARLDRGDLETVYNSQWGLSNGLSLYAARGLIEGPFALMMSDHLFDPGILRDLARADMPSGSVTLAVDLKIETVFDLDDATKVLIEDGMIVSIGKEISPYNAIDCGLFLCTPEIFTALGAARAANGGDCSLSHGMQIIGERRKFFPFDIRSRWWQDVDTPEMLTHAAEILEGLERDPAAVRVRG
jgi:1L-myo-inositol 1-phosphate cytidylyltransferase